MGIFPVDSFVLYLRLYSFHFVFQNLHVWIGGLFIPEAYITASRQYVAQANSWSLEELHLDVSVHTSKPPLDECSFGVTGNIFHCY